TIWRTDCGSAGHRAATQSSALRRSLQSLRGSRLLGDGCCLRRFSSFQPKGGEFAMKRLGGLLVVLSLGAILTLHGSASCRTAVPGWMRGAEEGVRADSARGEVDLQAGLPRERGPDRAGHLYAGMLGDVPLGQDQLSGRSRELPRHVQSPI